jgi:hypothetical protein
MGTYSPVQNVLNILEHLVNARIPAFKTVSNFFNGTHSLVDARRQIPLVDVAGENEVDEGFILTFQEVAQDGTVGAKPVVIAWDGDDFFKLGDSA